MVEAFIQLQPRLLSRANAAAYCGVSINHFMEHIAPVVEEVPVPGKRLWDRRSIDAWIDAQRGVEQNQEPKPNEKWLAEL